MITMEFDTARLNLRLGGLVAALKDMRPVWPDIHQIFMGFMKQVFAAQGAYGGPQWAPLSPAYAAWKRRHYPNRPILQLTRELYRSFVEPKHSQHVYRVGLGFMETGSSVRYARAHQWGYPPTNLPARPIIRSFTKAEGEMAADAVLAYLLRSMRQGPGVTRRR